MSTGTYKIQISLTRKEEVTTGHEWEKGGTEDANDYGYGYTPLITTQKNVTRDLLIMQVSDLDVAAVIEQILQNSKSL